MDIIIPQGGNTPLKQCSACLEILPATTEFFWRDTHVSHGLKSICKQCYSTAKRSVKKNVQSQHLEHASHKPCSKCCALLPETPDFFTRHVKGKNGLAAECKKCKNDARRKPHVAKEPIPAGMKQCSMCTQVFPATPEFFTKHPQKVDGLNPACKECRNNRRKGSPSGRKYQLWYEATNRKEISRKARIYRNNHKDVINAQHRLRMNTESGKMIRRAANIRRKARKRSVPGTLTAQEIQAKLKAQKYRCYYAACGYAKFAKLKGKYIYHIEHTVPLSRTEANPRHDINFVVLACPDCNLSKGSKLPHEFFEGGRLF